MSTSSRFAPATAGFLVLAACACGSSAPHAVDPSGAGAAQGEPEGSRSAGPSADYEVHEWGLVRGGPGDTQRFDAIAPVSIEATAVDKPVLYFHAPAALTLRSVSVEARSGGTLLETWPLAATEGARATWTNVAIDPSGACEPSPLAMPTEPPCAGLPSGEVCETLSLASVRTGDGACVHVGDESERFLFYRGRAQTFTPPLRFERTGAYEVIRVTNEGDAVVPGMLVRLSSDGARVRTLAVAPPPPHQSIEVHADFDAVDGDRAVDDESDMPRLPPTGPGRDALRESMRTIGLTDDEADAFFRAWDAALFGPGQPALDTLSADLDPAPVDSFVYFLPADALEDVAHLELDPPPSGGVHRAIAMWSVVRGTGATH